MFIPAQEVPEMRSHMGETPSDSGKRPRNTFGVGRMDELMEYTELTEVPPERLNKWEKHRSPDHKCRQAERCWFRHPDAVPILKKFLESPPAPKRMKHSSPFQRGK